MITMILLTFLTSTLFCFMNHPLTMGLTLLFQMIMIALLTGPLFKSFWFSYIIFLVMIGGMLTLFIYMTSIASNEKFKFSWKIINMISLLLPLTILGSLMDKFTTSLAFKMNDLMNLPTIDSTAHFNKYLNYPHNLLFLVIIIYLLVTLIAIVKITTKNKGSLRQKF